MKVGLPIGLSTGFWFLVGLLRTIYEALSKKPKDAVIPKSSEIAAVIPAHNEEKVITACIRALKQSLDASQIFVASDGSLDRTTMLALAEGCQVIENQPGVGKAKALIRLIQQFHLYENYNFVFIVDADTQIDKDYINKALPFFADPKVGVVFATARIHWKQHIIPQLKYYFIAYRERLNRMMQFFLVYGQTWKYTNTNFVIPGFATIYRVSVLKQLEIDTPGLLIEDFNLGFQFHRKKLGTMGYHPDLIGWDQHPDNLVDYWKQVRRWNIGFFQTVKKNGIWPSFFWLSLGIFSLEVIFNSLFTLTLPFLIGSKIATIFYGINPLIDAYANFYNAYGPFHQMPLALIIVGVFWMDYGMTVVYGLMGKKPQFIIYGLFFFFMHFVTSLILISAIIPGFFGTSEGKWISPTRRTEHFAIT